MLRIQSVYSHDFNDKWQLQSYPTQSDILLFLTAGTLVYWIEGEEITLRKGDVLYIPKGAMRSGKALDFHHRNVAHFFHDVDDELIPLLQNNRYIKSNMQHSEYFKQRFTMLIQHWMSKLPHYEAVCHSVLFELLALFNREADTGGVHSSKRGLAMEVREYILHHVRRTIRIEELAELTGKTPNYISTVFKEVTGQTPIGFHHMVRIAEAREMLLNTNLAIGEIADYLGFCDAFYFHRVFKKMTGMSPSAFVKANQC